MRRVRRRARPLMMLWCLTLSLLVLSTVTAAPACPDGTLTIGTDATFPPFSSRAGEEYVGFEIDLGDAIARALGCKTRWVNASFDGIFPALLAGKYDMVLASVTITPERQKSMLFSEPYMNGGLTIAIRKGGPALENVDALKGKRVGVGLNTTGQYVLEPVTDIKLTKYPSVDLALQDLSNGRLDAAVGDLPVFRYMLQQSFPNLALTGSPLNSEQWGIVFAPARDDLRRAVNEATARLRQSGEFARLEAKYLGGAQGAAGGGTATTPSTGASSPSTAPAGAGEPSGAGGATSGGVAAGVDPGAAGAAGAGSGPPAVVPTEKPGFNLERFGASIPIFIQGARWTLLLSLLSFLAALPLGLLIALGRMSRLRLFRLPATTYVEILRGTPLLVQIFFIYFVLPQFGLSLQDVTAAILALSINASAYISEIFRAGLQSLEAGQGEAAQALGMTHAQALRYVLVPQAFRRVVPPLTNECIALIKESSLVSVMGMTELTRTGQELASRYGDPITIWPGIALTYFILTFPLTRLSATLEERLHRGQRRLAEE